MPRSVGTFVTFCFTKLGLAAKASACEVKKQIDPLSGTRLTKLN